MEQWAGSKLGKEYIKPVYCHPAYLTYPKKLQNKEHYQRHHSVTKIRQRHYQEGKSQANIFDDDRCKNFQQKY